MEAAEAKSIPFIGPFEARLVADYTGDDRWSVRVALHDRRGALAAIAGSLAAAGVAVAAARIATGPAGMAVDVFDVRAPEWTDWEGVRRSIGAALVAGSGRLPIERVDAEASVRASPDGRRSIVDVRAADRVGLLARVAGAMTRAGLEIHAAVITTEGTEAADTFEVTGPAGGPLTAADRRALTAALAGKKTRRGIRRTA